MKVLHITNWYPSHLNPHEATWIRNHIEALSPHVDGFSVLHLEVKHTGRIRFHRDNIDHGIQRRVEVPIKSWFLIELITAGLLIYYLIRLRKHRFDLINFHIAYPLLVYWRLLKMWFKVPVVITEHWSAYHFNFGVPLRRPLSRIKRIFSHKIPLIAVSEALARDIKNFSKNDFPFWIVPNVVDDAIFYPDSSIPRSNYFFMVSQWKWPKRPVVVLEAFKEFLKVHKDFRLMIGGYGPEYPTLISWIRANGLNDKISLLGPLTPTEVAAHFRECRAFLHATEYETFSVVCAEALCCHTPILASAVGGILEVVKEGEGLLLGLSDKDSWVNGMHAVLKTNFSHKAQRQFLKSDVGCLYFQVLSRIVQLGVHD